MLVATLHSGQVSTSYAASAIRSGLQPTFYAANPNTISDRRNEACRDTLAGHEWLLFVDSDMGWLEGAVEQLVAAASPDRPVVGALCFGLQYRDPDGMGGFVARPFPTVFDFDGSFTIRWNYERDTVTKVAGTGCAFLLIHRDALEKFAASQGETWFDRCRLGSELLGEDLSFCARAGEMGIPIHVHTGVKTSHHKATWVDEAAYVGARLQGSVVEKLRGA